MGVRKEGILQVIVVRGVTKFGSLIHYFVLSTSSEEGVSTHSWYVTAHNHALHAELFRLPLSLGVSFYMFWLTHNTNKDEENADHRGRTFLRSGSGGALFQSVDSIVKHWKKNVLWVEFHRENDLAFKPDGTAQFPFAWNGEHHQRNYRRYSFNENVLTNVDLILVERIKGLIEGRVMFPYACLVGGDLAFHNVRKWVTRRCPTVEANRLVFNTALLIGAIGGSRQSKNILHCKHCRGPTMLSIISDKVVGGSRQASLTPTTSDLSVGVIHSPQSEPPISPPPPTSPSIVQSSLPEFSSNKGKFENSSFDVRRPNLDKYRIRQGIDELLVSPMAKFVDDHISLESIIKHIKKSSVMVASMLKYLDMDEVLEARDVGKVS
ncbi:hypothetical protein TanjilG_01179 [Lupinus angustifolius]|uniref:Uncharacterized protein n=1 Tax=Lupinus angustifolius TaxID=3871 RepID=A0A1J7IZ16_LUPAN|nr:hypothetical protein TanjilG_01179 [Lupinus angustifolius]